MTPTDMQEAYLHQITVYSAVIMPSFTFSYVTRVNIQAHATRSELGQHVSHHTVLEFIYR